MRFVGSEDHEQVWRRAGKQDLDSNTTQTSLQNTTTDAFYYLDDLLARDADSTHYDAARTHAVARAAESAYLAARDHLDDDAARDAARCAARAALDSYDSAAGADAYAADLIGRTFEGSANIFDNADAVAAHVRSFTAGAGLAPNRAALRTGRLRALAAAVALPHFDFLALDRSDAALMPAVDNNILNDSHLRDVLATFLEIGRSSLAAVGGAAGAVGPADRDGYDEDWE
ncbi:unnamed protein product [Rotaria sp. Silwood2]|nr:unnamed protein product [Rotaria sp. Silwood2]CAF3064500.1 unnamed protein product [Rotaria sp. Silwood2]CAF3304318.1 unnamed protein product [Rotaria sp. Silwood2]CAF4340398.1 unnamed protein product [Rotaria sp. Silwood2]CAF4350159.1 unnamed protein product [Rotaria sp. Silwood2]